MIHYIFVFFVLSIPINLQTCNTRKYDYIIWDKHKKITWADFKGPLNDSVAASAITVAYIKLDAKFKNDMLKSYKLNSIFSKNESWYRDTTANLLVHEQGHFDITEIITRQLRQRIAEKLKIERNLNSYEINVLYNQYVRILEDLQKLYDEETLHSQRTEGQVYWNNKINKLLHTSNNQ